jgi:hypothetical protein
MAIAVEPNVIPARGRTLYKKMDAPIRVAVVKNMYPRPPLIRRQLDRAPGLDAFTTTKFRLLMAGPVRVGGVCGDEEAHDVLNLDVAMPGKWANSPALARPVDRHYATPY